MLGKLKQTARYLVFDHFKTRITIDWKTLLRLNGKRTVIDLPL